VNLLTNAKKVIGLDQDNAGKGTVLYTSVRGKEGREELRRARLAAQKPSGQRQGHSTDDGFPKPAFGPYGKARRNNLLSSFRPGRQPFNETAFSTAVAYPFLSGTSLGHEGAYIGDDEFGGGAFVFDPWELYRQRVITGMSMIVLGAVGTGKSTCVKSIVSRLVLLGRKAVILADRKGEWDAVAAFLAGSTIKVGPGEDARINPLDEGIRPLNSPDGSAMTDAKWAMIVRARRLNVLITVGSILMNRPIEAAEHTAMSMALDKAVAAREAAQTPEAPTLPEFTAQLAAISKDANVSGSTQSAADTLLHAYRRCSEGDLAGMFDGPTTAVFDPNAPIITVNTKALVGASPEARKVAYACTGSWAESMITNDNAGRRLCVYEEGWDSISDEASLNRMVEAWKLARDFGIFNILIVHKLGDLDIAGDAGSSMAAKARSLLGDTEIKVVYRQEAANLAVTQRELGLTDAELDIVAHSEKGTGLWKVGQRVVSVRNLRTKAEVKPFDTDARM
jgi:hypothetical protein